MQMGLASLALMQRQQDRTDLGQGHEPRIIDAKRREMCHFCFDHFQLFGYFSMSFSLTVAV